MKGAWWLVLGGLLLASSGCSRPSDAEGVAKQMKEIMEGAMKLDVPLKVDVGIGKNWAEIH